MSCPLRVTNGNLRDQLPKCSIEPILPSSLVLLQVRLAPGKGHDLCNEGCTHTELNLKAPQEPLPLFCGGKRLKNNEEVLALAPP